MTSQSGIFRFLYEIGRNRELSMSRFKKYTFYIFKGFYKNIKKMDVIVKNGIIHEKLNTV